MLRTAILIPILSLAVSAQTSSPTSARSSTAKWEALKSLTAGTEVRVAAATAQPTQGELASVTDSALVLSQVGGPVTFDRAQIRSVSVEGKTHRLRNAMIGLGVGTAVGIGIGYAAGRSGCVNGYGWCNLQAGISSAIGGASGLTGGTLTGAFWHTGGWQKIYTP
jgi:hypothetical protein